MLNMTIFRGAAPCSVVENDRSFRSFHDHSPDDGGRLHTSETSASSYETTRRNILEHGSLNTNFCENLTAYAKEKFLLRWLPRKTIDFYLNLDSGMSRKLYDVG
jgi:hypothetical protein